MKLIFDKILILLMCLPAFLITEEITTAELCSVLSAVIVTCVSQAAEMRNIKKALIISYCIACLLAPEFVFTLPLAVYETVRIKSRACITAVSVTAAVSIAGFGTASLYPLLICIVSAAACIKTLKIESLFEENIKSRDDGIELERLMKKRNRELGEMLEYEVRITALNERNRIAREIHDNVGHLLSRSLLQTGALSALCPKEQTELKSGIDGLRDTLNSAMNSIRESVHGIRDEALDLKLEAEKIVSPLREKMNTELSYDISGELPPKIKLCFISILKEAVSNISRHSSGDKAVITLREHPSLYQLIVYDNGSGKINVEGMGIGNMRDRAEAVGGNFSVNDKNGFTVFVSVRKEKA